MNEFEYYASLLGLLMGLSLVEVIGGAVRTAQSPRDSRVGVLTPLLALFVMLDVTSYWENAWVFRDKIEVNFFTLYIGLFVASAYYYLASRVFPARVEECQAFDDHFMLVRRHVLSGLVIVNLPILVPNVLRSMDQGLSSLHIMLVQGMYLALLILAAVLRDKRAIAGILAASCLLYLFWAVLDLIGFESSDNRLLFWIACLATLVTGFVGGWSAFVWRERPSADADSRATAADLKAPGPASPPPLS